MASEIITRRNLPHWYVPGAMHFVTFRLAETLPREVIDNLNHRKEDLLRRRPSGDDSACEHRLRVHKQVFAAYDSYLDNHRDIVWLSDPRIAALVRHSLYHLHDEKYALLAFTIMPNHVHLLILPHETESSWYDAEDYEIGESADPKGPLASIMHSLKSYTAHEANKILRRNGTFWQHESYDHWVRDEDELERIVDYINGNPVKVGLAERPHEWYWTSAHDRFLIDGDTSGWLNLPVKQASRLLK
jgi:putative transposase